MTKKKTAKTLKLAIVCAYRKEESDLQATLDSASESIGDIGKIIAVEDKDSTGPGRNRDRGIMAADTADVIIIIDAHMRFQGDALLAIAKQVHENGGLVSAVCHHNERMDFAGAPYTGAWITWAATDHTPAYAPLAAKWCSSDVTGPRNAVMGACYAFRRQWYLDAGRPLAMLPGWGGDEEALSIAAWLCGEKISVCDQHVAHLYRARQPWGETSLTPIVQSREALIHAFVIEQSSRLELMQHLRRNNVVIPSEHPLKAQIDRVKTAMLKQKRTFQDWRREVCDRQEVGIPNAPETVKNRLQNPVSVRFPIVCPHCSTGHDQNLKVHNTYPNGRRRHICPACHLPFQSAPKQPSQVVGIPL